MVKYWDSYFDLDIIKDEVSYGQLVLDAYYPKDTFNFMDFFVGHTRFLETTFGEVCEAVTVSDHIRSGSQAIYNKTAWDKYSIGNIDDENLMDSHEAVIYNTIQRISKYRCTKIGLGFMAKWKNPYIRTGDQFRWGVNITFQYRKNNMMVRMNFSKPSMWFSTNFRPLFPTDKFVRDLPNLPYNRNERGVIVPIESLIHDNRVKVAMIMADLYRTFSSPVLMLAYTNIKYSPAKFQVEIPKAQIKEKDKESLFVGHRLHSSIDIVDNKGNKTPSDIFLKRSFKGVSLYLEETHFGFIKEDMRR